MRSLLDSILRPFIRWGRLTVRWPDGATSVYRGSADGPEAGVALRDARAIRRLALHPGLGLGEAYMDGSLVPERCSIYELLDLLITNLEMGGEHRLLRLRARLGTAIKRWVTDNPAARSRRNVAHHYDLNGRLYSLFLDRDRQYSCAYFPRGDETLEEAQLAKKRHIAAKLRLDRPGLTVLDIGCGWGGMALTLAQPSSAPACTGSRSRPSSSRRRPRAPRRPGSPTG